MTKKVFAIIIAIVLMLCVSNVFAANNELGDSMNKAGNTVRNVVGGAENVVEDAAGAIGTGIKDTANAVGSGVRDLGNTFSAGAARVTNNDNMNNDNYTTTRTATTRAATTGNNATFLGMSANTWTWFILAIVTLAIVGLVWYYAMQNKNEYTDNH